MFFSINQNDYSKKEEAHARRSSLKDTAPTMIAYGKLWVVIGYAKLWCAFGTVWKQAGDHIITFAKQTHNGEQMRAS